MGSLCSRLKVRIKGSNTPRYNPIRSDTPTSIDSEILDNSQSVWMEAREMVMTGDTIHHESNLKDEETTAEIQFDKMAAQIRHLYQPVEFLHNAVINSLLLVKVSLKLTKTSSIKDCFEQLKMAVGDSGDSIELINTSDGPRKLSITNELWRILSDDVQSSISHFNSMLSSCHKYLGSKELKLTDIQIKLDDMQLLPRKHERNREYKQLKGIVKSINDFSLEIETMFSEISAASQILEHQIEYNDE